MEKKNTVVMPRATAKWLLHNTTLSFEQIAEFTSLPLSEIHAMANGIKDEDLRPENPITIGQLTAEAIACSENTGSPLVGGFSLFHHNEKRYIPKSKRPMIPAVLLWVVKNIPYANESLIEKIFGTTKNRIRSIKKKQFDNLVPINPVDAGICDEKDIIALENSQTQH